MSKKKKISKSSDANKTQLALSITGFVLNLWRFIQDMDVPGKIRDVFEIFF